jgi:small subunit ribosomal protein S1
MMTTDDGLQNEFGGAPPPMDESWWAAVLQDEGRIAAQAKKREETRGIRKENLGNSEDWDWAQQLFDTDDTVTLPVIGYNRGGILVEARSLRGFVPVSHLVAFEPSGEDEIRTEQLSEFVGRDLNLKVIEHDVERGRLVFSERAALAGPGRRTQLLESLEAGECVRGKVTNITRFGVFVDLGGVEGLIHVSELSWGRVRHPTDVVACGEDLEVQVLSVDREQGRVALSLKELLPDPWTDVDQKYDVGQVVQGTVTNVVKFGAFVGIEEGLEGLIHVSELGDGNLLHPRNVVEEGEHVRVRIIHIDAAERRLGLSLRQISQHEDNALDTPEATESPEAFSSH